MIGLLFAALLASGCTASTDAGTAGDAPATSQPAASGQPSDVVRLEPQLATHHATTASVGPDGATLDVTDDSGTRYVLEIPANALAATTDVTMTPIAAASGLPEGVTWHFGVEFAPSGLQLARPALLTIEREGLADMEFVGYRGPDRDVYLTEGFVDAGRVHLQIGGFSGRGGVGCGGPCINGGIQPLAPGEAAGAYESARQAMLRAMLDQQRSHLTGEGEATDLWEKAAREVSEALAKLLQECRESNDIDEAFRTSRRITSLAQMAQLIGLDEALGDLDLPATLDGCLRFEFELDSRFDQGDGVVEMTVEHLYARFPLQLDHGVYVGEAPFEIVDAYIDRPGLGCIVGLQPDMTDGDYVAPVKVHAMRFVFIETPDDDVAVHDVELLLDPGHVLMHQTEPCSVEIVTILDVTTMAYMSGWDELHSDEFVPRGMHSYWRITGWDILHGGGVAAEKRYQRSDIVYTVPLHEDTTLRILLKPQA